MDVLRIAADGVTHHAVEELPALLADRSAFVWVDMPMCAVVEERVLREVFGFHGLAVRDCVERNHISQVHFYDDHVFTVLHAPELGTGGHVHYVELDQFIGPKYLITVHGPLNPAVDPARALVDTQHVLDRLEKALARPANPVELSCAIVSAMVRREVDLVASVAAESGRLEQLVTDADRGDDPEILLEDLFEVSHELLAIRTIAAHSAETYRGLLRRARSLPEAERQRLADIGDRFEMVRSMADGQKEFVHGVIEFFQTRTTTHLTVAAEDMSKTSVQQNDDMRKISAWVAIFAVPTGVTGFFGQNLPYPGFGKESGFVWSTIIMVVLMVLLYVFFRRRDWL